MFSKILIVYSEKISEQHLSTIDKVKNILKEKETKIIRAAELNESYFQGIDLVITIGGDGTFVRAAAYLKDIPILGINSEPEFSEGALTSINDSELEFLNQLLQGNFKTIKKRRIKLTLNGKILDKLALDEVYIGTQNQFHTSRYIIKFHEHQEEQRSSGVLVVTGSGSTAWYKSAGGTAFSPEEKKLRFLVREFFVSRIFKPKIILGEILENEKIEFESRRYDGGILALDGNFIYNFNVPDKIILELSDIPLNVIIKSQ